MQVTTMANLHVLNKVKLIRAEENCESYHMPHNGRKLKAKLSVK